MPILDDKKSKEREEQRRFNQFLNAIYLAFNGFSIEWDLISTIIILFLERLSTMQGKEITRILGIREASDMENLIDEKVKEVYPDIVNESPKDKDEKIKSQEEIIKSQGEIIKSQGEIIKSQGEIIKSQEKRIKELEDKLEEQEKKWQKRFDEQEQRFNSQITALNQVIYNQNIQISNLNQQLNNQKIENSALKTENIKLKQQLDTYALLNSKEENDDYLQNVYDLDKRASGKPWRPVNGFVDTLTYFFPCRDKKREIEELKSAASDGNVSRLLVILNKKSNQYMDVNGRGMPDSICSLLDGREDKTALILAAKNGHVDCVRILLRYGAEINFVDRDEMTALDYATKNQDKDMINFLKRHSARTGKDILFCLERSNDPVLRPRLQFNTN
jgi:regulator of replication initiation timing